MNEWLETMVFAVFPRRCAFCGKTIPKSRMMCEKCEKTLPRITGTICDKCGRGKDKCTCKRAENYYSSIVAPFYYEGCVRHGMHIFKFRNGLRNYEAYSVEMSETIRKRLSGVEFDYITEIPITKKKRRRRGYNQCSYLAKGISKILGISHKPDILKKIYETQNQHSVSFQLRKGNLTGAFDVSDPAMVKDKIILICDDVSTSGETLNECAKMLWLYGAKEIHCITLALTNYKK